MITRRYLAHRRELTDTALARLAGLDAHDNAERRAQRTRYQRRIGVREQHAAVGAAARSALPAAVDLLTTAEGSWLDVAELLERTRATAANAEAFTAAYRRHCWPTDGLRGARLAPFQLLATEGAAHHTREHAWHLDLADRLVAAEDELIAPTRRTFVDTTDEQSVVSGVDRWTRLTAAGG